MSSINQSTATGAHADSNGAARKTWLTVLETRFAQAQSNLNASRKQLIRSILENAEENYFLSSRALAKRYGVDKATIGRSVQLLGWATQMSRISTHIMAIIASCIRAERSW
jgi:recombinational DNA repair ATPase RecF